MNGCGTQSLFFIALPELRSLCCVNLFFPNTNDEGELRKKQVKTCRELLLLYSNIIASPVLGHFGGITVVMTNTFYKKGIIQDFAQTHGLQFACPQRVSPPVLQACLSYSVAAKLAPKWNKAGQYLIAGREFLNHSGKLNAVVLELNITETQLCVSVEANTVRLPPAVLKDLDFPTPVVEHFLHTDEVVLHATMPNNWCHILPSMKKGQLISISRRIPQECPFQSYSEIQEHWDSMYGYQLPSAREEEVIYCSVYFKPIGEKLLTYPLCCIRTQPVQCFPRVDLQGVLRTFISDLQAELRSVCGFPVQMSNKPFYYNHELIRPVSEYFGALPVNLTTENTSKAVLNHLPNSYVQNTTQHRSFQHDSTGKQAENKRSPSLESSPGQKAWTFISSTTLFSASPTNVHFTHSQSQSAVFPRAKLVPVFKNKSHTCHLNVNKIPVEEEQRGLERQKVAVIKPLTSALLQPPPVHSSHFSRPVPERVSLPFYKRQTGTDGVTRVLPNQLFVQTQPQVCEVPSKRGGDTFESKPKRLKQSVQDVDMYAKNKQLTKVNSVTLQAWLKSRGVSMHSKVKKEELVSKVMKCLSET
ncbi:hypothetical protein IRJ41_018949 [Triplophysa rosa]|uniref:DUF4708 domain-containing protein n=1 Tax=Triplophysa rosa TaxID=992332 RepID=A0A9W7T6I5_TRIRA|nr:hypothetical protein IRJ41_018949 [Triplophysa rosa]